MNDQTIKLPIKPEQASKILADNGLQVSEQDAGIIVTFLTKLAQITYNNEKRLSLHPGKH